MKESKIKYFMEMAEAFAQNSHDTETHVGAVLISDTGRQVASGVNGFLSKARDEALPTTRPHKHIFIQHAERNLLYNCLDEGISTRGKTLICTLAPCEDCLRACYQSGIKQIIYRDEYLRNKVPYSELADINISATKLSNGFTVLDLRSGDTLSFSEVERRVQLAIDRIQETEDNKLRELLSDNGIIERLKKKAS